MLEKFHAWRQSNTFVTDNTVNMKLTTKKQLWLGCAGHNLNLVLAHRLKEDDELNDVTQLIRVSKSMVAHVKRTCIQAKFETTLKQALVTRRNIVLIMLHSIASNADNLKKLADKFAD